MLRRLPMNRSAIDSKKMNRLALLALFLSIAAPVSAQGTHLWSQSSFSDFEHGTPEGVSILSVGGLEAGLPSRLLATADANYIWSTAADSKGNVYLATGSPAGVIRVAPDGKQTKLFTTKDISVQVVRIGPDGSVYAATLPSGKVYRLAAAGEDEKTATVVFDPAVTTEKPKYIWDLAFDSQGRMYVAAGGPAAIYRVSPGHAPELFFKSDEQHIRALAFAPDGALIAGTDGSGLVYRIDSSGKGSGRGNGYVLFEAPRREITSLAVAPSGAIYLAAVGEKGRSQLPPLPVTGTATVTATITIVQPGSVQAFNGNSIIPDGSEIYELSPPGRELSPSGTPRRLWAGHDDIVYALRSTPQGLLAATGNRGHVYRIGEDGSFADIAHLDAAQAVGFAPLPQGLGLATANPGKLYLLTNEPAKATYTSQVFDAQVTARWGRAEIDGSTQFEVRSGNIENPERGWTDWRPVAAGAASLGLEPSRYLQWRATLAKDAALASVGINYLPVNLAPVVDELVVVPGARVNAGAMQPSLPQQITINFPSSQNASYQENASTGPLAAIRDKSAVTARWAAHDDNGDELSFSLYYRAEGQPAWRLLKDHLTERFYTFDASLLPDGPWRMKVVASDEPSHAAGDALTAERESDRFLIDTATPSIPALEARLEGGRIHVTATATDPMTPIAHAEYSVDAGRWQYVEPAGKLSDALIEHYDFSVAADGAPNHLVTLRVYDRYDNSIAAKTVAH
jgi:sugar lactone lactonase YvrE